MTRWLPVLLALVLCGADKPEKWIRVSVTAYCMCAKCTAPYNDGKTATNTDARKPGIAVDPKVIPLGTVLDVPGYGKARADDVGGAIKGRKIDVRFRTHQEALNWGRKILWVRIVD